MADTSMSLARQNRSSQVLSRDAPDHRNSALVNTVYAHSPLPISILTTRATTYFISGTKFTTTWTINAFDQGCSGANAYSIMNVRLDQCVSIGGRGIANEPVVNGAVVAVVTWSGDKCQGSHGEMPGQDFVDIIFQSFQVKLKR